VVCVLVASPDGELLLYEVGGGGGEGPFVGDVGVAAKIEAAGWSASLLEAAGEVEGVVVAEVVESEVDADEVARGGDGLEEPFRAGAEVRVLAAEEVAEVAGSQREAVSISSRRPGALGGVFPRGTVVGGVRCVVVVLVLVLVMVVVGGGVVFVLEEGGVEGVDEFREAREGDVGFRRRRRGGVAFLAHAEGLP